MSTTYFIGGSVFILLSIIWAVMQSKSKRNVEYEKASKDLENAIDSRNWDDLDDAYDRMLENK